ncbi:LysR family transcriptional regulator [Bradyrhizobium sp. LjRoot220]|uniref:LysR family transcriptional regulator n=1 Tax=Bradyrhizobium sp. LjRoot220 TaxID=3342284 RepID=UPI003ECE96F2
MDIRLIRSFVEVIDRKHFGRAAEALHTTQPAISQHVKKLEERLGCSLLERSANGMRLTPAGGVFLAHAKCLLALAHRMDEDTRAVASGGAGSLSIGLSTAVLACAVSTKLRAIREQNPLLKLSIAVHPGDLLEDRLLKGEVDLAITTLNSKTAPVASVTLFDMPLGIAMPGDHPAAQTEKVSLEVLDKAPLILFPREAAPAVFDSIIASCHSAGLVPEIVERTISFSTVMALVASGAGFGFIPVALAGSAPEGVVIRPIDIASPPAFSVQAQWLRSRKNALNGKVLDVLCGS